MSISSEPRSPWIAGHVPRDLSRPKPWLTAPDRCRGEARLDQTVEVTNRAQFEARLTQELQKSRVSGQDFVLIVLDVDELSRVNDEHGCQKGNEVILLVAHVLQENARGVDLIAHFGDDEFVVLIPNGSLVWARDFFERVRAQVAERSELDLGLAVSLSAGAVKSLDSPGNTGELLGTADYAMYLAKRQGRDRLFTTVVVGHDDGENGEHENEKEL